MSKENALELLIKSAEAAVAYDLAIQGCADDPDKMSSYCTAQGDDLDTLYFNWQQAARAGLEAVKVSPATGNKVAEQGDRERFEAWYFPKFGPQKKLGDSDQYYWTPAQGAWQAWQAAVSADRASRQVANKAEVEPSESYKSGYVDGMEEGVRLALWADKPSEKFPEGWPDEVWLNAGDDELGPFSEYDEVSWCSAPQGENDIRYIREDLLATPPATTGASTVPSIAGQDFEFLLGAYMLAMESGATRRHCADCKKALVDYIDRFVATNGKAVGASTVLTDERIIEDAREWGLLDIQDGGRIDRSALISFVREVAAQAGQVAVPEGFVLVPKIPTTEMLGNIAAFVDHNESDADIIYRAMLAAAPSPAKESK